MAKHTVASLTALVEAQALTIEALTKRIEQLEAKPQAQSTKRQDQRPLNAWRNDPMVEFQDAQLRRLGVDPESVTTKGEAQDLIESLRAKAKAA